MNRIIAVIDDSEIMRDAMVHLLCAAGFSIETYASAREFLNAADISQANCLVVDVELGDMSGIEMVRQLSDRDYSFPVILMTASPTETRKRAASRLGCLAFLPKPFPPEQMLDAVEQAFVAKPDRRAYQKCA